MSSRNNTPRINWESMSLSTNTTHVAQHSLLIDVMLEHGLEQIVNQPTHQLNILDLFFLITPAQSILSTYIEMRSEISKQNPREIYLYHIIGIL